MVNFVVDKQVCNTSPPPRPQLFPTDKTQGSFTQSAAFWEFPSLADNNMERAINSSDTVKGVLHRHQALKQAEGWYDTLL